MLMGGSDPARGVAAARTEQDHVGQLRDPLDCGSAARAADRELYAMFLRLHIMPWFGWIVLPSAAVAPCGRPAVS
jgi:hypothetical protein